uniref:Polymerase nucleotidyl transferase domain-containing protein n=1 Tax=Cajanus cajan TaxID=3821 RepID=A0A151TR27_CAJCA|nr:hypothetical protein KK1_008672 [Cajanus cajan]
MAEERAQEILWTIEPNVLSEVNRKDVIDYVQRLIRGYYGAEVFPLGSVPLKTYLPDGDIDLTALSHEDAEEDLAHEVYCILQNGDDPEYQVKDIQYIRAQVQLVKCTVKNIAVDISFNQMAGLYTLRFLEQVDQLVGKNHLFKRSIILVKAWCYYESRLLGGHHGLLSTYAIEILVLYIINRCHSSVRGPLEVLYMFLDYYGSFDWDHNYVSIWGPKALSSLPEIVETPECDQGEFLLQKEFLRNYRDMCSFSAKASETMTHEFPVKFMNILDPLRNDNNLGRSVNIASLHRLKFALSYGAKRLKQILTLPGEEMGAALEKFYLNTLDRNGKGERADVDVPVSPFGIGRSEESVLCGDCDSYYGGLQYVQLYRNYAMPPVTVRSSSPSSPSQDDIHALSMQQNWNIHSIIQLTALKKEGNHEEQAHTYLTWPRRFASVKHYALPKSPPKKQQAEEVHSETDMSVNSDSRPFDLVNEDFPVLPCARKATPPIQAQESAPLVKVHSETYMDDMDGNSQLFELSNKDFPLLPKVCSETHMDSNSRSSYELSKEDFPFLPSTRKTLLSESAQLTKQAKKPSLSTKDEKEDSAVSFSKDTLLVVPKIAMEKEEESTKSNEKMD